MHKETHGAKRRRGSRKPVPDDSISRSNNIPQEANREEKKPEPYVRLIKKMGSLRVWTVDGSYVRKNISEEFTNFGQHYTYPEITKNELWIDVVHSPAEYRFYIHHMLYERRLMARGTSGEEARKIANKKERKMRLRTRDAKEVMEGDRPPDPDAVHERLWKKLGSGAIHPDLPCEELLSHGG